SRWRSRSNGCDPFSTQAFGATARRVEWAVASRGAAAAKPGRSDRRGNGRGGDHDYPNQQGDCSMEPDDGRLIARFQRLTTELLAQKRLGQWHPELVDDLYRTSLGPEQRGLNQTPEYRNALLRADEQAWRLVEWARLSGSDAPTPPTAPAEQLDAPTQATDSPPAAPAEQPDVSTQATDSPPAGSVHED